MSESSNSIQSNSSRPDSNHSNKKEFVIKSNENDLESSTSTVPMYDARCERSDTSQPHSIQHTASMSNSNEDPMIISVNDNDLGNSTPVGGSEMMDKGNQCCFDPLVLISVGTQTDSITCETLVSERCSSTNNDSNYHSSVTPESFPVAADKWKICNDYTYAAQLPPYATSIIFDESLPNIPLPTLSEPEETGMSASCTQQDSDDDIGADHCADDDDNNYDKLKDEEGRDPTWKFPGDEFFSCGVSPSSDEESENESETSDTEKMYLVSESCLSKLLRRCPECGDDVIGQKQLKLGSMLTVTLTCCNGGRCDSPGHNAKYGTYLGE